MTKSLDNISWYTIQITTIEKIPVFNGFFSVYNNTNVIQHLYDISNQNKVDILEPIPTGIWKDYTNTDNTFQNNNFTSGGILLNSLPFYKANGDISSWFNISYDSINWNITSQIYCKYGNSFIYQVVINFSPCVSFIEAITLCNSFEKPSLIVEPSVVDWYSFNMLMLNKDNGDNTISNPDPCPAYPYNEFMNGYFSVNKYTNCIVSFYDIRNLDVNLLQDIYTYENEKNIENADNVFFNGLQFGGIIINARPNIILLDPWLPWFNLYQEESKYYLQNIDGIDNNITTFRIHFAYNLLKSSPMNFLKYDNDVNTYKITKTNQQPNPEDVIIIEYNSIVIKIRSQLK